MKFTRKFSLILCAVVFFQSQTIATDDTSISLMRQDSRDLQRLGHSDTFIRSAIEKMGLVDVQEAAYLSSAKADRVQEFRRVGRQIAANIDLQDYDRSHVIVRLYREADGQLLAFDKQRIQRSSDAIVDLRQTGWQTGRYIVDVFADDESLTRIASGTFSYIN